MNVFSDPSGQVNPILQGGAFFPIVWKLSGVATKTEAFRGMTFNCCLELTVDPHQLCTNAHRKYGIIGAWRGIQIPCGRIKQGPQNSKCPS